MLILFFILLPLQWTCCACTAGAMEGISDTSYSSDAAAATSAIPTSVPSITPSAKPTYYPSLSPHSISIISTIAGTGTGSFSGDGGQATSAAIYGPCGIAIDSSGNLYVGDFYNNRIRKIIVSTGVIITYAGTGSTTYSGDGGIASSATLNLPDGLSIDTSDNLYICDDGNHRIRKVLASTSLISTIAGTGVGTYSGDNGLATNAAINHPVGVAVDASGDLFISDTLNNRIRKVTASTGFITTIAGTGTAGYSGDNGQATAALIQRSCGINLDSSGNIYFGDYSAFNVIRKITVATGIISTVAGIGSTSGGYNGDNIQATAASLNYPDDVVLDSFGNLYISDRSNNRVRKVTISTGVITTVVGTGSALSTGDGGAATSATVKDPCYSRFDSAGNYYISECSGNRVRKVVTVSTEIPTTTPSRSPTYYPTLSPHSISVISTIAGTGIGSFGGDNGQATSATLGGPEGLAVDSSGNVYIADSYNYHIRKVTVSTGIITSIAGSSTSGSYSGDNGQATAAGLNLPATVALDSSGNVYIADYDNHRVRKITVSTGIITTVAGNGGTGRYNGDNRQATAATLNEPRGVALDSAGNVYIADQNNHRIRKVTVSTGLITTIAGTGTYGYSGDNGQATSATVSYPRDLDLDSAGNVYIADGGNNVIRKITVSTGLITTIAGTGTYSYSGDNGQATSATLNGSSGVCVDASGNVYFADYGNNRIRKVTVLTGIITTIAGSSTSGSYSGDGGAATSATLYGPFGVAVDSTGNVYIADSSNQRIRKVFTVTTEIPTAAPSYTPSVTPTSVPSTATPSISPTYYPSLSPHSIIVISTVAGTGTGSYSGDNGPATSATINSPAGFAIDSNGNVYFNEAGNHRVRKITSLTGIITTYAGTGSTTYNGDGGVASSAALNYPNGLCMDTSGNPASNIYIAEQNNNRIRKILASTSVISTIAGTGASSYSGDNGVATSATLNCPIGVAVDTTGNVYIGDCGNGRIRKITASTGVITTIAGTGVAGYSGDGGPATAAAINTPTGVNLDSSANVYFGDNNAYNVIRKVTVSTGLISTVAGTGSTSGGYNGDNIQATAATLNCPYDVVLDSYNNLYISDRNNYRVRKVDASTGVITTVVGTGTASSTGDGGAATSATVKGPCYSRFDSAGNYYISEGGGNRVRKVITVSTEIPTASPTYTPSILPTFNPSRIPTPPPSSQPSGQPSTQPSTQPSIQPSSSPSTQPSATPSTQPTTQPTSQPTSQPTKLNIITANLLETPITARVVQEKTNYYLASYLGYFLALYICLYLFSFTNIGKPVVCSLYHSSYNSQFYHTFCNQNRDPTTAEPLSDIYKKMSRVMDAIHLEKELQVIGSSFQDRQSSSRGSSSVVTQSGKLLDAMMLSSGVSDYSKGYRKYMSQKFTLLHCAPTLHPNGYKVPCVSIVLPPGVYESIILYTAHNHPLFSCWYFMPGSKLGAHGTRLLYIGQNIVVFVLYQFSAMLLRYLRADHYALQLLINVFIITPSALSIGLVLRNLYSCPFTETPQFQRKYAGYKSTILLLGRLAMLPLLLIMGVALILACLFSQGRELHLTLINYFVFVQLYGILATIFNYTLLFVDNYSYTVTLAWNAVQVLRIGTLYKERIVAESLQVDRDYAYRVYRYLFGLVEIVKILSRNDAIKARWIAEEERNVEMTGSYSVATDNYVVEATENPLARLPHPQEGEPSVTIEVTTEEAVDSVAYDSIYSNKEVSEASVISKLAGENPLNKVRQRTNESMQVDDEALYIEYQHECSSTDTADYSLDTETLSFEEWKANKKQFKEGTRSSFVAAYQVFEQQLQDTGSVKNTMHLHRIGSIKENPLAASKRK